MACSHHAPAAACDWGAGGLQLHRLLPHWSVLCRAGLPHLLLHPARARAAADPHLSCGHHWGGPPGVLLRKRCAGRPKQGAVAASCCFSHLPAYPACQNVLHLLHDDKCLSFVGHLGYFPPCLVEQTAAQSTYTVSFLAT